MASMNEMICNCKQVSLAEIEKALRDAKQISDVTQAFDAVQKETNCSTGCGKCHDKIMDIISKMIYEIV